MPVITCPDCGRDVSTLASACPHCGRPSPAATAPILPSSAPPAAKEETVWGGSPAWSLLWGRIITLGGCAVGIPILTYLFARTAEEGDQRAGLITMGWFITIALVVVFGVALAVGIVRLRATRYTITNQRLLVESGVFSKNVDEIDMRLIDDSLFRQGLVNRLLRIGDVTVMSSDKNTPVFTLRGVRDPRAVRELIRTHAYHASQRQVFTRPT